MQTKWIGWSVTAWGTIITVLSTIGPVLGPLVGFNVQPSDVTELGTVGTSWINATGALLGVVMTLYGRLRATTKATVLPNSSGV